MKHAAVSELVSDHRKIQWLAAGQVGGVGQLIHGVNGLKRQVCHWISIDLDGLGLQEVIRHSAIFSRSRK
jgi:hypothetical protein